MPDRSDALAKNTVPPATSKSGAAAASRQTAARDCPVCGSGERSGIMSHRRWRLVACDVCGLAYLPETPTYEALSSELEWSESFERTRAQRWADSPVMRLWTLLVLWLKPSRERRALRWIRRFVRSGRMLDVGCGNGRLAAMALRRGFDAVGVEISPAMARRARRRLGEDRVLCGRLEEFDLEAGGFDLAVTVSYLEHESRPRVIVKRLFELLRPGGVCVHKVPNYESWLRRLLGSRWSGYRWPEHVQYFTPTTLGQLMEGAGFEVLNVKANPLGDNFWIAARKPGGA